MPSELKSETARINGAKSRGPTTDAGKATSSLNALKHGFTSRKTLILKTESPDEYQAFLAEHIAIHQPSTLPESELVDQMAIARWRIRRFVGAETVLIDCEMVRNHEKVAKEFGPTDSDGHLAMAIRSLADESRCLSLMSRYESRLQRVHDKAYAALRELQHLREPPPAASPAPPDPPPTAQASARGPSRPITQASARGHPPPTRYRQSNPAPRPQKLASAPRGAGPRPAQSPGDRKFGG
jgi:hypothetical protein